MNIKYILIGLCTLLVCLGCGNYNGHQQAHPCDAPFTNNLTCKEAEACFYEKQAHKEIRQTVHLYLQENCKGWN